MSLTASVEPHAIDPRRLEPLIGARRVEALMEVSGARMVYDSDPLQPILRDIVTIATHSIVQRQGAMVPWGRLMLGLAPEG